MQIGIEQRWKNIKWETWYYSVPKISNTRWWEGELMSSRDSWGWTTGESALPPHAVLSRKGYTACLRVQGNGNEMDSRGVY